MTYELCISESRLPRTRQWFCASKKQLSWLTEQELEEDEDGYWPPKYIVVDGLHDEWAREALKALKLNKQWTPTDATDLDDIDLKCIHVIQDDEYRSGRCKAKPKTMWLFSTTNIEQI